MSYPQFGYSFSSPSSTAALAAASQLFVPCTSTLTPVLPSSGVSPSCPTDCVRPVTSSSTSDTPPIPSPAPHTQGGVITGNGTPGMYSASSLLSYGPRVLPDTMYTSAYAAQGYMPFGTDPSAFYSPLVSGDNSEAWRSLSQTASWPYDPTNMSAYPYGTSYGGLDVRRKNATRESTSTLKAWLYEHIKNPYPTKGEKIMLAIITKMTLTQVSTWFANARRRLKKENKMQWSPRNRTGDDDDDKNSDDEDDDDDRHGEKSGEKKREDDVKALGDDEDIVVDGGSEDPLLSGQNTHLMHNKFDDVALLLRKDNSAFGPLKDDDPIRHLTAGNPLDTSAQRGLISPLHKSLNSSISPALSTESSTTGSKLHNEAIEKPRIWSLADVATSSTPPPSLQDKRSPLGQLMLDHGVFQHGLTGSGSGLSCPSLKMPHAQTAFSSPSSHATFQPWVNGTFNHQATGGASLPNYGSYSSLGPHHHPLGGSATSGMAGGVLGTGPHVRAPVPSVTSQGSTGLSSLTSSYASKLQTNGYQGDKTDLPHMSGFTSGDLHTAFKPVPKRL